MDGILLHAKELLHIGHLRGKKEEHAIIVELNALKRRLDEVDTRFDLEVDEDLIDACIYEKNSLLARYRHLLKCAKEQGITCNPCEYMPRFEGEYQPWG